jgi:hypothetical protein
MKTEIVYLTYEQAQDLVNRVANRTKNFNHTMSKPEKVAMAQLLSDIGVNVSDIIDVSNLADNYAINAEIVTPDEVEQYSRTNLRDALFTWEEDGETYYCLSW